MISKDDISPTRWPRAIRPGYVYFMLHDDGFVKVGHSKNPERRLRGIDIGPHKVRLLKTYETQVSKRMEYLIHQYWDEIKHRKEWFDAKKAHWEKVLEKLELAELWCQDAPYTVFLSHRHSPGDGWRRWYLCRECGMQYQSTVEYPETELDSRHHCGRPGVPDNRLDSSLDMEPWKQPPTFPEKREVV